MSIDNNYKMCSKTIMDTTDPNIVFDENGVSNHFYEYHEFAKQFLLPEPQRTKKLTDYINEIKEKGKGKKYDCLIGLSGGVDSTYIALLCKKMGLRPLAIHLDNGWNSELAVKNIENIINICGFDLYTLVINWEEFKDIQLSYLKASVVDIEVVSDHAIFSTMYKLANKYNLEYILSGNNIVTEFIMPKAWLYDKMDYSNLKDIHQQFGSVKLKTYPSQPFWKSIYHSSFRKLKFIYPLNCLEYNKSEVKEIIAKELLWRDYGGKHYESLFTKFYQAYILPTKFNIDKRKAHLSTLICSGQITREAALEEMKKPLYDPVELKNDKEYVLKKLGLTDSDFQVLMNNTPRLHSDFKSDLKLKSAYMKLLVKTAFFRNLFKRT